MSAWHNHKCRAASLSSDSQSNPQHWLCSSWAILLHNPEPWGTQVSDMHSQELPCQSYSKATEPMKRQRQINIMNYAWILMAMLWQYGNILPPTQYTGACMCMYTLSFPDHLTIYVVFPWFIELTIKDIGC